MNMDEFRKRLLEALEGMDREEAENAVEYYCELIEEADDPEEQMAKLGSPEDIAARIRNENGERTAPTKEGAGAAHVVAVVCTFPFWLTVFILLGCAMAVLWSVYAALVCTPVAMVLEGIGHMGVYVPYGIIMMALGVAVAGLAVLLFKPAVVGCKWLAHATASFARFLFAPGTRGRTPKWIPLGRTLLITSLAMIVAGSAVSAVTAAAAKPTRAKYAEHLGLENVEMDLGDYSSIETEIEVGKITVKPYEGSVVRLEAKAIERDRLEIGSGSDTLKISYTVDKKRISFIDFGGSWMSYTADDTEFTVLVPEKELDTLNIEAQLGEVTVTGVTVHDLKAGADCGDMTVSGVTSQRADLNVDLGELSVLDSSVGQLYLEADCGDTEVRGVTSDAITLRSDLGEGEFTDFTAGKVDIWLSCGDLDIKGVITGPGDSQIEMSLGDAELELTGGSYVVLADTSLGDVSLNGGNASQSVPDGSVVIRVHNDCGDITADY